MLALDAIILKDALARFCVVFGPDFQPFCLLCAILLWPDTAVLCCYGIIYTAGLAALLFTLVCGFHQHSASCGGTC